MYAPTTMSAAPNGSLRDFLRILQRRKILILVPLLVGLACAWIIFDQLTPRYEAQTAIVPNLRTNKVVEMNDVISDLPREQATIRTEMDVLQSRSIAQSVAERLDLAHRPAFLRAHLAAAPFGAALTEVKNSVTTWLAGLGLTSPWPATPAENNEAAAVIDAVRDGVSVTNDGQSYTLNVRFISPNAQLAAEIANAYADAYLSHQVDVKLAATREAHRWLSGRIDELGGRLRAADLAMDDFRRKIGIVDEQGQSASSLAVNSLNQEIIAAEARQREVDARMQTLRDAVRSGHADAAPAILASNVIASLKQQLADVRGRQAVVEGEFGQMHPQFLGLRRDRGVIEGEIATEVNRVVQSVNREAQAAASQVASLRTALTDAKARMDESVGLELQMRQREREVAADRELHKNYLLRMKQLDEQEQLQMADATVISRAAVPSIPSYPSRNALLLLGLFCGGSVGAALAFMRERLDESLYSAQEIEQLTGLPVLGLLPSLPRGRRGEQQLLKRPHSAFAEALRATGLAVSFANHQQSQTPRVIVVTSALPGEGKTTFCGAMTRQFALEGRRALLINADFRRPRSTIATSETARFDLIDLLRGSCTLEEVVRTDGETGADYLGVRAGMDNPLYLLESAAMGDLLARARQLYDIVIVDTPPVTLVSDAVLLARAADACLFFVRWGSTPRGTMLQGLRLLALCHTRVTGIVLSRVDQGKYEGYAAAPGLPSLAASAMAGGGRALDHGAG